MVVARLVLAGLLAGLTATLGALILGEYQLPPLTGLVAAALLGVVVAEVAVTAGGPGARALTLPVAAMAAIGVLWGGWIESGRESAYMAGWVWPAAFLAAAAAVLWMRRARVGPRPPAP